MTVHTHWDYIVVGGGLTGCVVAHRLLEHDGKLKILIIEAGSNPLTSEEILKPNPDMMLIGGDFDWKISSVPQANADNRAISIPQGKGLGGGTVINAGGWIRGDKADYDAWAELVADDRWSYNGLLPFMKKTEKYPHPSVNPDQHGFEGKAPIQTVTSSNRPFPSREKALKSWAALGVQKIPNFDANAGNSLGVGEVSENRDNGRRELAPHIYSLDGITVKTDTLVEKVLLKKKPDNMVQATGVKLTDGTEIYGQQVILSAGPIRTSQLLMLSGIGPADELSRHGIQVQVELSEVGKNLVDHTASFTAWKVKNPKDGWAMGSPNQLFAQPQYTWGAPADFLVTTTVPRDGLANAIEADERSKPDSTHPLLKQDRPFLEYLMVNAGAPDGSVVAFGSVVLSPTSRGSVKLASTDVNDVPLVDPNYLGTDVDRYLHRESLRKLIAFAGSEKTEIGRDILDGELVPPGVEALSVKSTDDSIDARARSIVGTCFHPHGTAAMGKVVDTNLKVKGVQGLRIVDVSVIPVNLATHLQVPAYALAEQAAAIIAQDMV